MGSCFASAPKRVSLIKNGAVEGLVRASSESNAGASAGILAHLLSLFWIMSMTVLLRGFFCSSYPCFFCEIAFFCQWQLVLCFLFVGQCFGSSIIW